MRSHRYSEAGTIDINAYQANDRSRRCEGGRAAVLTGFVLTALLSSAACTDEMDLLHAELVFDDWNRMGAALHEELRLEGADYVTGPIDVGALEFDRVSFMFDSEHTPAMDVRVSYDGGRTFSEWVPATITWRESIAHSGHADVPPGGTHIQLRFSGVEREELSYLFVDAFVFAPEPAADPDEMGDLATLEQDLAANQGVDVTRAQWNARSTRCSATHTSYRMTVHHTVTPASDPALRMRQMQNYHMDSLGWCDIGYHFNIGRDGKVYQARHERYRGAHVGGANTGNAGVSFIGDYTSVEPSSTMMNAGAKIIWAIADHYGIAINRDRVKGHREYNATACPGNALWPRMDHLVSLAQAYSGGGTTPTPEEGELRGAIYHGGDLQDLSNRISGAVVSLGSGPSTTTDGEGWYVFNVEPGSYTVTATASGYSTESISRDVSAGSTTWGSIRLYPEAAGEDGTVRGVVFWVDDPSEYDEYVGDASRRLAGATVSFNPGDHQTTTGSDGHFEIEVPAGNYTVTASADGYQDGTRPDEVEVVAGATTWGSTHVIRPGDEPVVPAPAVSITDPPDGATVTLDKIKVGGTVNHAADLVSFTVAGEDVEVDGGTFEATVALSEGQNLIEAVAEDAEGQVGDDSITVVYEAPEGGIDGFVYDASEGDEARVFGAVVWLPEIEKETETDAAGAFSMDLDGGTYALRVEAEGYVTHRGAVTVVPGRRLNLRIGLEPGDAVEEQLVEFFFPVDGEVLERPEIIVMAAAAVPDLGYAEINGEEAALGDEGSFSASITLEPGENVLEAVAFREGGEKVGRATITVVYEGGGGCGCASSGGHAGTPSLLSVALLGMLLWRRRRA